jgi:hypothetical protein
MLLLDAFGCQPGQQVPLLLTMGELPVALTTASAAADVELTHLVLLHARSILAEPDLCELLILQRGAQQLLEAYCKQREPELLKTLFYHVNHPVEAAAIAISEAYRASTGAQRMRGFSIAVQLYEHATQPQCAPLAKATEEQLKLLDAQRQLERGTRGLSSPQGAPVALAARFRFLDTPLNETICKCFAYGQTTAAERLRSECKVPEKRWWHLKLKGLAQARNWSALWELGSARRSPIGFQKFVEACVAQGAHDEAAKYIPRLPGPVEQVASYLQIGQVDEARRVAIAHKEKHPELLQSCLKHEHMQ